MLGEILERVSKTRLDRFITEHVTRPLGLVDTTYLPPGALYPRIAATEWYPDRGMVRGAVHDPVAYRMGGISGHAGLFSTATDLARLGQMMLNRGEYDGRRVLAAETVDAVTSLQVPSSFGNDVGLGWELNQTWYMGELTSHSSFGHTGYAGTSIVFDPDARTIVVLLANRVHPDASKPGLATVRQGISDAVASALP